MRLTAERLRELLDYDPDTGTFTRKQSRRGDRIGMRAGSLNADGYVVISVDGQRHFAHRLAWLYVRGCWPKSIDHRDGVRHNNRIDNLREATQAENSQNHQNPRRNKSGVRGVWQVGRRWRAAIRVDGRMRHIGMFDTADEAASAFLNAKRRYHPFWHEGVVPSN